jgi:hypothetical protein
MATSDDMCVKDFMTAFSILIENIDRARLQTVTESAPLATALAFAPLANNASVQIVIDATQKAE